MFIYITLLSPLYIEMYIMHSFELLGSPQSFVDHNIVGNFKCDGLKTTKIGQSAAKPLDKFDFCDITTIQNYC